MWIRALGDADASCGAKAHGLARLITAGLRVPDGFVIEAQAFAAQSDQQGTYVPVDHIGHELAATEQRIDDAELPAELDREVRARAAALGRLAVRSSASIEDGARGAAAGVFASFTDVPPERVWDAIRAVWRSALTPLAVAYARRRNAEIAIAVIVQRFVPGERMTIYTRPVGSTDGDELIVQREAQETLTRIARAEAARAPEAAIALAAEAVIGAGADVELIRTASELWIVQARPIVHPDISATPRRSPPPILLAPLVRDGRRWTWDIAHNPDPLSPAQAGLVECVDRAAASPYALRVCGGYLYTAPRDAVAPVTPPADRAELAARIAAIEARFVLGDPTDLGDAVARYVDFMRIWSYQLSPLVATARRVLLDELAGAGHPIEQIPRLAASLIGARRVVRDRVMSPAWDVVVPTFAEYSAGSANAARELPARSEAIDSAPIFHELTAQVDLARAAADAAEHDDLWFARAQWMIRRALLACSEAHGLYGDDIFWLPLEDVITLRSLEPDEAHRRASAARAAHARAAEWDMPTIVHGADVNTSEPHAIAALRGVGVGPRVVGRVVRFAALRSAIQVGRGDVIVTRAITPALAMIVDGCAALVSETGGLLDHGAALARELGIPCVVGCAGAWAQLEDGATVIVDGDAGHVTRA